MEIEERKEKIPHIEVFAREGLGKKEKSLRSRRGQRHNRENVDRNAYFGGLKRKNDSAGKKLSKLQTTQRKGRHQKDNSRPRPDPSGRVYLGGRAGAR